jgi:hypothetical protein
VFPESDHATLFSIDQWLFSCAWLALLSPLSDAGGDEEFASL